ncbi:MAG: tetratricopeptide repeat protein [Capnocytophaga sp.]|nr:tetratricopeptide repeat protein [Capnocytophaga sp.]
MKKIVFISALAISSIAFAQKKELKEVSKLLGKGELTQAESLLEKTKSAALADAKYAPEYHLLKGQIFYQKAEKGQNVIHSLQETANALKEYSKAGGKETTEVNAFKEKVAQFTFDKAIAFHGKQDYKNAAPAFELIYRLIPNDTTQLNNAAMLYVQDKNYDNALRTYIELRDLGFDGSRTIYSAKNKETQKVEEFPNKETRNTALRSGQYFLPKDEKTPSLKPEIIRNIAFIYVEQGKKEEAVKAFDDAIKMYPKDAQLVLAQGQLYYQLGDTNKFTELLLKASEIEPNNPNVFFNIGTVALDKGNLDDARKYLEKAIQIKPDFPEAVLNLANTYIQEGNVIGTKMEELGNTKAEIQKYNELNEQRKDFYKKTAKVLDDYTTKYGKNENILELLKNVYTALGDTANFKRVKDMLK